MKYTELGDTGIKISRACLGTMGFGEADQGMHQWTLPYEETKKIIKQALDSGINFIDTAPAYSNGTSEEFIGRALKDLGVKREDVVIATKYLPKKPGERGDGMSDEEFIRDELQKSLDRLGMDYVDLYIMHRWDDQTPIEETLRVLNNLVDEGKIKAFGISNAYGWQVARANEIAKQLGLRGFSSIQGHHNAIFREEEREMIPAARFYGMSITPYSALAAGRLSRKPGENTSRRAKMDDYAEGKYGATAEADEEVIREIARIADGLGVSMTAVAIAWLLNTVDSPVVGATKPHHLDGIVEGVELELTPEQIEAINKHYVPHALVGMMKG